MMRQQILRRDQSMYFLDPDRLAELADVTYRDCMARNFGQKAVSFVQAALSDYVN